MKHLLIISILALSAYSINASFSSENCAWETAVKAVVKNLTPTGQQSVVTILQDFQLFFFAAAQPVYDSYGETYKNEIASVLANDAAQLGKLEALLGVGNYTFGSGNLVDLCNWSTLIDAALNGFKAQNIATVQRVLNALWDTAKVMYKPVMAAAYVNNLLAYQTMLFSETPAHLAALQQVFGYN